MLVIRGKAWDAEYIENVAVLGSDWMHFDLKSVLNANVFKS